MNLVFLKKILPRWIVKKIEGKQELQKILFNINWLTFEKFFEYGLALFVGVWVARYLGPEQYGVLSYVLAFLALFAPVYKLGLDQIIIRNIVQDPEEKEKILGTALFMKFVGAIFLIGFAFGVISLLQPPNEQIKWFVLLVSFGYIFRAFEVVDFYFQSQVLSKYSVIAKITAFSVSALLKIVFVLLGMPLEYFVGVFLVEGVLIGLGYVGIYIFRYKKHLFSWNIDLSVAKNLLGDGWPLLLSSVAIVIYMKIDQIMIGQMLGERELGIYSVAVKISEIWYIIPTLLASSVFPMIIKLKKADTKKYFQGIQNLYDFSFISSFSFAIFVTFFSQSIIGILFGKEYLGASLVLAIHVWAGIFVSIGVMNGKYLLTENLTGIIFTRTLIGAIFNIILNLILIPLYGIIGAAIATLLSYFLQGYLSLFFFKRSRKLFFMATKSFNILRSIVNLKNI